MAETPAQSPERRGATSRASLLLSARRLFSEHGFHGTSVGDIADAAGLRKPSLFHHFPTKEALYRAVMDEMFSELATAIAGAASARGTYAERLDAMNDALVAFFVAKAEAARLLFREALEPGAVMKDEGVSRALTILAGAEQFLSEGMAAGEFIQQDPKQLLLSLTGIHLTYFAIQPLATPIVGMPLSSPAAAKARQDAVRAQVRAMVVKPKSKR